MTLANWVRAVTGADPAAELRRRYWTAIGWKRIVNREGGLIRLVGRLAAESGMARIAPHPAASPGDIAVVDVPRLGQAGAIRTERGFAMKLNDGLTIARTRPLAVWGFG